MTHPAEITITVRWEDAFAVALSPLDYTMKVSRGEAPPDGSPYRLRQACARAVGLLPPAKEDESWKPTSIEESAAEPFIHDMPDPEEEDR